MMNRSELIFGISLLGFSTATVGDYNTPLMFDFALKRLLRVDQSRFPANVFETRRFFNPIPEAT